MPVTAICPECQATYKLGENFFGKQVRCKKCQKIFVVGKAPASKKPAAKKTMMASGDAIQETKPQAPRPAGANPKPAGVKPAGPAPARTSPQKPADPARRGPVEDDEVVEAAPARRGKSNDDDDEIVEAAPARRGKADDDDLVDAAPATPRQRKEDKASFVAASAAGPRANPRPAKGVKPPLDAEEAEPRRGRRDRDEDLEDEDRQADYDDAPPRKRGKGLLIGLIVGIAALVGGGVLVLLLVLGKSDPNDDPEVNAKLEDLKENRSREDAVFFFANYPDPTNQVKRKDVALTLETILKNNLGGRFADDTLIQAYCRWATVENIPGMVEMLEGRGGRRLFNNRDKVMEALGGLGEAGEKEVARFLFHEDPFLRTPAQEALRRAGAKQEKFIDGALVVLLDRTHRNRDAAATFLSGYRDPPADRSKEVGKKVFDVFAEKQHFNPQPDQLALIASNWVTKESADVILDGALALLLDKTHPHRNHAVNILKTFKAPPDGRSKEVCEKMMAVIQERAFILSDNVKNALTPWINKESATTIAKIVRETDPNINCESLILALAPFKDLDGVGEAIASRVVSDHFGEQKTAEKLVATLGPAVAAKGLLMHFNTANPFIRERIRNLVSKAGISLDDMLAQSIRDLSHPNNDVRYTAVEFLSKNAAVEKLRNDAAKGLNNLIYEENFFRREQIFTALGIWGNKDTVVLLCKVVNDPVNRGLRHKSIDAMAKMGNPALAGNIAYRLKFPEDRGHAANVLRGMGVPAEPYVAVYVLDADKSVRAEALRIIEQIGTKASLPTLQKAFELYSAGDRFFGLDLQRIGKTIGVR